jgi:CheY-like chemotaxis protein
VSGTILVVDDDAEGRATIQEALEDEGYEVWTADNGKEALQRLRSGRPDLVFLDLLMPVMDGWQFLEAVGAEEIPVVVVSAHISDLKTLSAAAWVNRPVGFLRKPVLLPRLLEAARTFADAAQRARSDANKPAYRH